MPSATNPPQATRVLVTLFLLAVVYYFGAWLCAALTASAGLDWLQRLAQSWHFPPASRALVLSLFDAVLLVIIAIPIVGIMARVRWQHRALWAAAIALPATIPWLRGIWAIWHTGFEVHAATWSLLAFDVLKTVLIPAVLAPVVPRFLFPVRAK